MWQMLLFNICTWGIEWEQRRRKRNKEKNIIKILQKLQTVSFTPTLKNKKNVITIGKTSKLICPPIDNFKLYSKNSFSTAALKFSKIFFSLLSSLKSFLSSEEQFLPIGDTLIKPVLYSTKVPLFTGISKFAMYFKQKFINFCSFSSPRKSTIF